MLNEVYSSLSQKRRYEVWFVRLGLADGSGAWWFRYLLFNPGRSGCAGDPLGMPVQVWATWFPAREQPQSWIQGFPLGELTLSPRNQSPLHFGVGENAVNDQSCRGSLNLSGHRVAWDLRYTSAFHTTLSDKGWIGFSRTPHSDAAFSGFIALDGRRVEGKPLGFGVQGHNCGYRHRSFWNWAHACFDRRTSAPTTLEALVYDLPLGMVFRKVVFWHDGRARIFRRMSESHEDRATLRWNFRVSGKDGSRLDVALDGSGPSLHRLPYMRTDCSGSFEVANNSLASAIVHFEQPRLPPVELETRHGAVLEMGGVR